MTDIPTERFEWRPCFRIVPSRFPPINLLEAVADPADLEAVYQIEAMTNDRLREEVGDISLVPPEDRVSGPGSSPIMAAFTHLNPEGDRFTNGTYGVGGRVKRLKQGRITETPNITPTANGDNVVALVKPGEALLNESQQAKVKRDTGDPLYFDRLFNGGASQRRSRGYDLAVPAFASGGSVSSQTIVATLSDEDRALLNKVFTSIEQ